MVETVRRVSEIMDTSRYNRSRRKQLSRRGYTGGLDADTATHLVENVVSVSLPELNLFESSLPYRPYRTARVEEIADFWFPLGSETLGKFLHLIDICIPENGREYIPKSVTTTFAKTGYVRGGWVPHVDDFDVSAGIIRVPRNGRGHYEASVLIE